MAPTANAAFIIGGKTIDSALGFSPSDINRYTSADAARMARMKFQYEDVQVVFCDEISMVGSTKLAKINYRFQDLADGSKKHEFMGGISFVASGIKNISLYLLTFCFHFIRRPVAASPYLRQYCDRQEPLGWQANLCSQPLE